MIAAAAASLSCVLAAFAAGSADRVDALDRAGRMTVRVLPALPQLRTPDVGWRGWLVIGAVVGWLAGGLLIALLGVVAAMVAVSSIRRRRGVNRTAAIDEQLADAVRALSAGMRAGLSVPQAIGYAAGEGVPPLSEAFARISDTVALGGELDAALDGWANDVGSEDARLLVGVLGLHRRTGGDLPRVLDQVAATLRERTSAAREVRALTAQARLSGAILGLLPIGFFGFLWMTSRDQIDGAFRSPVGIGAIILGLGLEAVAFLWIRKLLEVA
ncbi:MAG: type II secretion system F family protein [Solirubrobacterales bacterium]